MMTMLAFLSQYFLTVMVVLAILALACLQAFQYHRRTLRKHATRRIRERMGCPSPMVEAMTANAFEEDRRRCFEAGMDEFMAKPFTKKDLARILQQLDQRKVS
jgi:hypothetical protein